jgi:hypothetical protein
MPQASREVNEISFEAGVKMVDNVPACDFGLAF